MRHDGVADVELGDLRYGGDGLDVVVVQPVPRVDLQAQAGSMGDGRPDPLELFPGSGSGFGVGAGVDLHNRCAGRVGGVELRPVRRDEQRDADAGLPQREAGGAHPLQMTDHVQPALGGALLAPLRHQADVVRAHAQRERDHLVGHRALQIHASRDRVADLQHVGVLDVPAILAQVQRDRVRPCRLGHECRLQRAGIARAARLPQRGDVVDVDT